VTSKRTGGLHIVTRFITTDPKAPSRQWNSYFRVNIVEGNRDIFQGAFSFPNASFISDASDGFSAPISSARTHARTEGVFPPSLDFHFAFYSSSLLAQLRVKVCGCAAVLPTPAPVPVVLLWQQTAAVGQTSCPCHEHVGRNAYVLLAVTTSVCRGWEATRLVGISNDVWSLLDIVTILWSDCRRGLLRLAIAFIERLQIVTTSKYNAIANSHTLQFTSRCLVTAFNAV
jgi:hypothetical protein